MDHLVVMKPLNPLQLGFGSNAPKAAQVKRYNMALQFTGENTVAQAMMQEAILGSWLNNSYHPHCIDWGSLRTDFGLTGGKY